MSLTIKGDPSGIDVSEFTDIVDTYDGKNAFIKDVLYRVEAKGSVTVKQIEAVVKVFKSDQSYIEKNKERLERMVPMKEGRNEVVGTVVSLKEYENRFTGGYDFKMLIEDFKGYRVFGSVPKFFQDKDVKVGDFVKFSAKLRQKELGFGFYSYPKEGVFVDGETAQITKEAIEKLKPAPKTPEEIIQKEVQVKKELYQRELMDFLSA